MKSKYIAMILCTTSSLWAFAGPITSGGGDAVVCYEQDQATIKTVTLLDLYEARPPFGDGFIEEKGTALQIAERKLVQLDKTGYGLVTVFNRLRDTHSNVVQKMKFISRTDRLENIEDSHHIALPTGCNIEQAAAYVDDENIFFDERLWDHMSETNRAALLLHESLYRLDRAYKSKNDSSRVRKLVGKLFAPKAQLEDLLSDLSGGYICRSVDHEVDPSYIPSFSVFYVNETEGGSRLRFLAIGGDLLTSKVEVQMPGLSFQEADFAPGEVRGYQLPLNSKTDGRYSIKLEIENRMLTPTASAFLISMESFRSTGPVESLGKASIICQQPR